MACGNDSPMIRIRYPIKLLAAAALYYTGLLNLYLRFRYRNHALVLLYHRVLTDTERRQSHSSESIIVTPATFERHLRLLRRHFTIVDPDGFVEWLRNGRQTSKPPCLITFDDGWKDNRTNALPILHSLNVPVVIFLPTAYIGTGNLFWQERFSHLLEVLGRHPALRSHPLVSRHGLGDMFVSNAKVRLRRARFLARSFKNHGAGTIESIIAEVTELLRMSGIDIPRSDIDAYLSWDDVQELRRTHVHFGSHAVSHRILTLLDPQSVYDELASSRRQLEQRLQQPPALLAYPNGNHDDISCRIARESGYQFAFTTVPGWVSPQDDRFRLPRINIHEGAHRHTPLFLASLLRVM